MTAVQTQVARWSGLPTGTQVVACPKCGQTGTHLGTCDFSLMRSGKAWLIAAVPAEPWPEVTP